MKLYYSHHLTNVSRYNSEQELRIWLYPDPETNTAISLKYFGETMSAALVEIEHAESADDLRQLAALARAIETRAGGNGIGWIDAERLANTLRAMGAIETVYDHRESKRVALPDVLCPEARRYVDDYERTGDQYCQWSVIAIDEQRARQIMTQAAARDVAEHPEYEQALGRFTRWTAAGRPVRCIDYEEAPDTTTLIDRITAMKGAQ